jgi:ligand-binding sensor domain-containing protein/two-component sensor histidine kinase
MALPRLSFRSATLLVCVTFILVARGRSQDLRFDYLSTEQGLSQDIITAIVQDHRGFMWFGTEDGLNRYDGYSIKVYKHDPLDSTSIVSNWINALFVDNRGNLWVGEYEALDRYDEDRDVFVHYRHNPLDPGSLSANCVKSICGGADNTVWVGTVSGLNRLDPRTWKFVRYRHDPADPASLSSDEIGAVCQDAGGGLWVGTTNGLNKFISSTGSFEYFPETSGLSRRFTVRSIPAIFEDSRRNLWIAQSSTGLLRFNQDRSRLSSLPANPSDRKRPADSRIFSISEDRDGRVWFGFFSGLGMYDYVTDTFTYIHGDPRHPQSLKSDRIYSIYRDQADAMWLGTWQGGVNRYDPNKPSFSLFRHIAGDPNSLGAGEVLGILEDRNGEIWVGTGGGGLSRYNPRSKTFHNYVHHPGNVHSISSDHVAALVEDANGDIWSGCVEDGTLDRFERKRNRFVHYPLRNIQSLCRDSRGDIWVGLVYGGAARYNRKRDTFTEYSTHPADSTALWGTGVWCIYEDRNGMLWIGTWQGNACLNRYDRATGRFAHFVGDPRNPKSINNGAVRTVCEDAEGLLWLGTWGGGLNRYDPRTDTFSHLTERDGLPSNYVKGVLADGSGRLWISTERGLSSYDARKGQFKNYTTDDGLQGYRFLSGSYTKGPSGRFYFGGEHGFNAFYPDSIRDNPHIPPVLITRFTIFDSPAQLPHAIWTTEEVRLSYDQNFFSFEFVALDYSAPARNRYAYCMEGFDNAWVQSGSRRYAAYTHLEPGAYVFRVRGSNNHGVWNEAGASIRLVIMPPFWRTWWFYLLSLGVIAFSLYATYRYRVRKLLQVERLRTRIASDLHDELASNLTSIAMFSKIVRDGVEGRDILPEQHTELLERITTLSQNSVSAIRDIIWAIDPRTETLSDLLQRLNDAVVAECLAHSIVFRIQHPLQDSLPATNLLPEQRRHLSLILKEAVHNAIKHAGCSEITVSAIYSSPTLTLTVQDNGRGFECSARVDGKGLGTMRMRAEQLGGELSIETGGETGTRVLLKVRM